MTVQNIIQNFQGTLSKWQTTINSYPLNLLCRKPSAESWSIGQVVNHFIIETQWFFEQAKKAMEDEENVKQAKSPEVTRWFSANNFPDKRLKGPEDIDKPLQPKSENELTDKIEKLTTQMLALANTISEKKPKGKAKHPGHGFLTAQEWLQYAEMHCRHHFRQKERIEKELRI